MNRKQKVAVVVGSVVILLLVLFPVWKIQRPDGQGGVTNLRSSPTWIFSHPEGDLRDGDMIERDGGTRDLLAAITLALTVAAVVVLKERKPAS